MAFSGCLRRSKRERHFGSGVKKQKTKIQCYGGKTNSPRRRVNGYAHSETRRKIYSFSPRLLRRIISQYRRTYAPSWCSIRASRVDIKHTSRVKLLCTGAGFPIYYFATIFFYFHFVVGCFLDFVACAYRLFVRSDGYRILNYNRVKYTTPRRRRRRTDGRQRTEKYTVDVLGVEEREPKIRTARV